MRRERYLECLAADERRLRDLATGGDLAARVPTCPDWTLADLVEHVGLVYLHKVETMRHGQPREWPPVLSDPDPVALLDRAYRELGAEFAARPDDEASDTWYEPDRTVGFWVRRMAQETVIHRIDAELAAGVASAEVPDDLAADGIDEVLITCLSYASRCWPDAFAGLLPETERRVLVGVDGSEWLVRLGPAEVSVAPGGGDADTAIRAAPGDLLRWLWRRSGDEVVRVDGDETVIPRLRRGLEVATQ